MQVQAILGVGGFLLLVGCGGRVDGSQGSDENGANAGNPNGGTLAVSVVGAGGSSRDSAPPSSSVGGSSVGGNSAGTASVSVSVSAGAGGSDDSAGAAGIDSGCGRRSLSPNILSPHWEVVAYNPCQGDEQGPADEYHSVWSDGPNRVWLTASIFSTKPASSALLRWEKGIWYSELSGCQLGLAVHGARKADLWLAGCGGRLLRRDGPIWNPVNDGPKSANRVWVNSGTDIWSCCAASGSNGSLSASHWDGSNWTAVPLPSPEYEGGALWSSGPQEVWIADRDVLHWDGTTWQTFIQPDVQGWRGVWGDGTNVWAVGRGGGSEIARWNGVTFEALSTSAILPEGIEIEGVWGSAPNDVWFVGLRGAVVHWNGHSLERESTGLDVNLFGVWGAGGVLWVAGAQQTLMKRTLD